MLLLLHIIVTCIKENIITKLQKLYSPPRNPRAGNKLPACVQNIHWKTWTRILAFFLSNSFFQLSLNVVEPQMLFRCYWIHLSTIVLTYFFIFSVFVSTSRLSSVRISLWQILKQNTSIYALKRCLYYRLDILTTYLWYGKVQKLS